VHVGKAVGRSIENKESADAHVLHEPTAAYSDDFGHEMGCLTYISHARDRFLEFSAATCAKDKIKNL